MLSRYLFVLLGLIFTAANLPAQLSALRDAIPLSRQDAFTETGSTSRNQSAVFRWQCPGTGHYQFHFHNHQSGQTLHAWNSFPTSYESSVPTLQPSVEKHLLFAHKDQFYVLAVSSDEIAPSPFALEMTRDTTRPIHDHFEAPENLGCTLATFESPDWSKDETLTEHFGPEHSLWYSWETPTSGTYSFSPGPERTADIQLFDPETFEALPTIGSNNSVPVTDLEAGQKVLLGTSGSEFSIAHLTRPRNDRIASARKFTAIPDAFTIRAELLLAEASPESLQLGLSAKIVWYEIALEETAQYHLCTEGIGDGLITAFFEKPNGQLGRIGGGREELWLTFRAGTRYFIAVGLDEESVRPTEITLRHQDLTFKRVSVTPSDYPGDALLVDDVGEPYLEFGYVTSLDEDDHLIDEGHHTATKSIWKKWVADFSGTAVINHYNQTAVFESTPSESNRIDQAHPNSSVARTFPCTEGHTYWIWSGAETTIIHGWFITPFTPFDNEAGNPRSISGVSGNDIFLLGPQDLLKSALDDRRITPSLARRQIAFLDWICPEDGAYHFQIDQAPTGPVSFDGIIYQENPDQSLSQVSFGRLYHSSYSIRAQAGRRYLIQISTTSDHRLLCFGNLSWEKLKAPSNDLVARPEEILTNQTVLCDLSHASLQASDPLITNSGHHAQWDWPQAPLRTLHYRWTPTSLGAYEFQLPLRSHYLTIFPESREDLLSPPFNSNHDFYVSELQTYRITVSLNSPSSDASMEFTINPSSRPLGEFFETPFLDDGSGSTTRPAFSSKDRVYDDYRAGEKNLFNSPPQKAWSKWTAQVSGWYVTSDQRPAFRGTSIATLEVLETAFYVEAGHSIYYRTGSLPEEHLITIEPGPETNTNLTRQDAAVLSGDYPQTHQFTEALPGLPTLRWYSFTIPSPKIIAIETQGRTRAIYLDESPTPLFDFSTRRWGDTQRVSLDAGTYVFSVLWETNRTNGSVTVSEITEPGAGDSIDNPIDLGSSLAAYQLSTPSSDDLSDPPIISSDYHSLTRDYPSAWALWTAPHGGVFHFAGCEIHPFSEPLASPLPSWGPAVTLDAGETVLLRAFYNNDSHVRQLQFGPISDLSSQDHGSLLNAKIIAPPLLGSDFEIPLSMFGTTAGPETLDLAGLNSASNLGWYRWRPASPGNYDISIQEGSLLELYKRHGNGDLLAEDLVPTQNPVSLLPGEELFILASKRGPTHPTGDLLAYLTIEEDPINSDPAPNDQFVHATEITPNMTIRLRTGDASIESNEPPALEGTVWWKFTPSEDLGISIDHALFETGNIIEFFEGDSLTTLSDIPEITHVNQDLLNFPALAGKTYFIRVQLSNSRRPDFSRFTLQTGSINSFEKHSLPVQLDTEATFAPEESLTGSHWYHFAPTETGPIRLSFQQPSATSFNVYELIPPATQGAAITSNAPQWGSDIFLVEASKTYLIEIQKGVDANISETFLLTKAQTVANDRRSNAFLLPSITPVQASIPLANSSITADEPVSHAVNATWARYLAPEDGLYQIWIPQSNPREVHYSPQRVTVFTTPNEGASRKTTYLVPPTFTLSLRTGELTEFLFSTSNKPPEGMDSFKIEIEKIPHEGNERSRPLILGNTQKGFIRTSLAQSDVTPSELLEHPLEDDTWASVWWEWPATEENLFPWSHHQGTITVRHDGPQASEQRLTVYLQSDDQSLTPISFAQNTGIHADSLSASFTGGTVLIRYAAPSKYDSPIEINFERSSGSDIHGRLSRITAQDDDTARQQLLDSKKNSFGIRFDGIPVALLCWDQLRNETDFGEFLANLCQLPNIPDILSLAGFQFPSAPTESLASLTPEEFGHLVNSTYREDLEALSTLLEPHLEPTLNDRYATSEFGVAFEVDAVDIAGLYFLAQGLLTIADIFESMDTDLTVGEIFEHSVDSASLLQWLVSEHPDITWKSGASDKRGLAFANFENNDGLFLAIATAYQNGEISSQREQHLFPTSPDQFNRLSNYLKFLSNRDEANFFAFLGMKGSLSAFTADLDAEGQIRAFSLSDPTLDGIYPRSTQQTWNKILRAAGLLSNPGTYADWEARQIELIPGFITGKESDSNQNGQSNWEDYAFGNSPLRLNPDLTFSLTQLIEPLDVSYHLQELTPSGWVPADDIQSGDTTPTGDRQRQLFSPPKMRDKAIYRLHAIDLTR